MATASGCFPLFAKLEVVIMLSPHVRLRGFYHRLLFAAPDIDAAALSGSASETAILSGQGRAGLARGSGLSPGSLVSGPALFRPSVMA